MYDLWIGAAVQNTTNIMCKMIAIYPLCISDVHIVCLHDGWMYIWNQAKIWRRRNDISLQFIKDTPQNPIEDELRGFDYLVKSHLVITAPFNTLMPTWISNGTHSKVWVEIIYPFQNVQSAAPKFTNSLKSHQCCGFKNIMIWLQNDK